MHAKFSIKPALFLLVSIITFAVYLPALKNGFVNFDDYGYLVDNPNVTSLSAQFVKWAFTTNFSALWQPLTWISFSIDYTLWGGFKPFGFHLTSVVLHSLNAGLVSLLAVALVEAYQQNRGVRGAVPPEFRQKFALLAGLFAGLLFSLHPLRVEAVAWVFERKSVLSLFFCLPCLLLYVAHASDPQQQALSVGKALADRRYLGSLALFAMSLMSKPVASTLPVLLLIVDWHPLGLLEDAARRKRALLEKIPYLALTAAIAVATLLADRLAHTNPPDIPLFDRVVATGKVVLFYFRLMVWPAGLRPYYMYPQHISPGAPEFFLPLLALAALFLAALMLARRERTFLAAMLFFVIALLPVSGLFRFGSMMPADRYTYFPGLGPVLFAAVAISWLLFKALSIRGIGDILASLVVGCCCSILLAFGVLTVKHIGVWKDSYTFWNRVIDVAPATGSAYLFRGKEYAKNGEYDKALQDFDISLSIARQKQAASAYHEIYSYRGRALMLAGRYWEAAEAFNQAIETSSFEKKGAPVQEYVTLRDDARNRLRQQQTGGSLEQP